MISTTPVIDRVANPAPAARIVRHESPTAARPFGPIEDFSALSSFELADRLAQVWMRNALRLEGLDDLRDRIAAARRHLSTSPAARRLAEAHLGRLLEKQDACRDALRADRRTAMALVRECETRARNTSPLPSLNTAVDA